MAISIYVQLVEIIFKNRRATGRLVSVNPIHAVSKTHICFIPTLIFPTGIANCLKFLLRKDVCLESAPTGQCGAHPIVACIEYPVSIGNGDAITVRCIMKPAMREAPTITYTKSHRAAKRLFDAIAFAFFKITIIFKDLTGIVVNKSGAFTINWNPCQICSIIEGSNES